MTHFLIFSVFFVILCDGSFLKSAQGMDKASLVTRGVKRFYSQLRPSLADFNLTHHYAFPLSMTALGKVFDKPDLLKFCVENLSGSGPLTNITVLKKASHHRQDFIFEALNNKEKPVCITLAASEIPRMYNQGYTIEHLDGCYKNKVKEWEDDDSKAKYDSYTAIHLFGETWEKPFCMGEALDLPYEKTLSLGKTSGKRKNPNAYKRYVLPTFLQPGYPYLDFTPNPLTDKESILYVLKYAFLLGDVPLHLRKTAPIEQIFQTLDATHWDANTWIVYSRECMKNAGFSYRTEGLMDGLEKTLKVWPLETSAEPERFADLTLTSEQINPLVKGCESSLKDFAEILLHKDRDILMSPDWKGFPIAGYRREDCFRNKMGVLRSVVALHNGLEVAKQIRRNIQEKVDPQTIFQTVKSKVYLKPEEEAVLRGYIGLPAPSAAVV